MIIVFRSGENQERKKDELFCYLGRYLNSSKPDLVYSKLFSV